MGWLGDHMHSAISNSYAWFNNNIAAPLVKLANIGRPLTDDEKTMVKGIYGDAVDYDSVRIYHGKMTDKLADLMHASGITFFGDFILIRQDRYSDDFSRNGAQKSLFVHEMAHIWQLQNGEVSLGFTDFIKRVLGKLHIKDIDQSMREIYDYTLEDGKDLLDFRMEQQASIIADYFNQAAFGRPSGRILNKNITPAARKKLFEETLAGFLKSNHAPGYNLS